MVKKSKVLCSILSIIFCLSIFGLPSSLVSASEVNKTKISLELHEVLKSTTNDKVIPVYIWFDDINYDEIEHKTIQKLGYSKDDLLEASDEIYKSLIEKNDTAKTSDIENTNSNRFTEDNTIISTLQEHYEKNKEEILKLSNDVDAYTATKRAFSREAYNNLNQKFITENLEDAKLDFVSQYAPMIICEITKEEILALNDVEEVTSISLYTEVDTHDDGNMNISIPSIDGAYTRDSLGFNGAGVRIGQIELGRPETGISELSGKSITRGGTSNNTPHASLVAAIMIGNTGMAPNAQLYSTTVDNFYANAEWLISSNVSVINRSNSIDNDGTYDNVARWVDHVVNQHNVSWVQTPGNSGPSAYVCSPGNAYNVITVGAIDDRGTVGTSDDIYYTSTNYKTGSGMPSKPDVLAPGVGFSVTGGKTLDGTSFAAPHVTGLIAQIMSFNPTLKMRPDVIKAVIMASCNRKTTGESMNSITNKEGAGVINAINAANSISNVSAQQTYYTTTASSISFNFYPLSTGTKTIAISWLKRNTGSGTNHTNISNPALTDFDLKVYDSSGNLVASSISANNSVELVRFNATTTSKYTVTITRFTNNTTSERIALAHVR